MQFFPHKKECVIMNSFISSSMERRNALMKFYIKDFENHRYQCDSCPNLFFDFNKKSLFRTQRNLESLMRYILDYPDNEFPEKLFYLILSTLYLNNTEEQSLKIKTNKK